MPRTAGSGIVVRLIRQIMANQSGATAIEYGLICSLIVAAILVGLSTFAGAIISMLFNVSNAVANAG
jgi:pilus assembly protein Flp/PilA